MIKVPESLSYEKQLKVLAEMNQNGHCLQTLLLLEKKDFTVKNLNQNQRVEIKVGEISVQCKHQVFNN